MLLFTYEIHNSLITYTWFIRNYYRVLTENREPLLDFSLLLSLLIKFFVYHILQRNINIYVSYIKP